jgi:hypothetical protein
VDANTQVTGKPTYRDLLSTPQNRAILGRTREVKGMTLHLRYLLSVAVVFFFASAAFSQGPTTFPKEESLYFKALSASIIEMEKSWGHINDSYSGVRTNYRHMLVEADSLITKGLPEQFGDYRVEYLETHDVVAKCKQLRKPFAMLKIFPMKNEGPILKIGISVYWVSYKKGRLESALSDWSEVELNYNCEKQSYIISNVKLGGV